MKTEIKNDGSVNLITGKDCGIYNLFPGTEDNPLHTIQIIKNKEETQFIAADGIFCERVKKQSEHYCEIQIDIKNRIQPIHTMNVFFEAELRNVKGIYQAAHGMGDFCGYISEEKMKEKEVLEGDGIFSVRFENGNLTFYALDHTKYRSKYRVLRKGEKYYLSCIVELENVMEDEITLPSIQIISEGNMEQQLCKAAEQIGEFMAARKDKPPAYHWCSWYYCYHNFDMKQVKEYLQGFEEWKYAHDMRYFQIDAGYTPSLGDWLLPNERFPEGLKKAVDLINSYGYVPGIWIGVFMVGNRSQLYREHPDWILYDLEDRPIRPWITDNEPKIWGYQDEEYYVLDTSHPEAMAYIKKVFRTFRQWGVRLFKTDFMLWGIQDSTKVKRYTPGKTSVEYFRELLQEIRKEIGEESYWLGCIAPFYPFIGYADGMRVGGDVGSCWNGEFGPKNMIRSVKGNIFMNHEFYQIDPDAVMLRDFHIRLTNTEIESLAFLAAMSGGCIYTSDPIHLIGEDRKQLFHFIRPEKKRRPDMPYLDEDKKEIVLVHKEKNGIVLFFNGTDEEIIGRYPLDKLGFHGTWTGYDYKENKKIDILRGEMVLNIPAHGYQLYKLSQTAECWKYDSLWENL